MEHRGRTVLQLRHAGWVNENTGNSVMLIIYPFPGNTGEFDERKTLYENFYHDFLQWKTTYAYKQE